MKTILIVHTENASRRKHFAATRQYGARLILIKRNPTWERQFVDLALDVDTRSIAKTVAAVQELRKTEQIDGVITFVEHSVPTASAVAQLLGLPFISEATSVLARDKYAMRRAFSQHGIPCPQFELAPTLPEAKAIAKSIGYPVVLKPIIGGGSMFIRRVDSEAELEQHFATIQQGAWNGFDYDPLYASTYQNYQGSILIESYVEGGEVSLESIIVNHQTHVLAIHDKPLPMTGPFFEEVYFTTPSRLDARYQDELEFWTHKAHEAIGIHLGATHTEFRLPADGPPIILETAARMGGGPIYRSVLSTTGIDMVHAIMDLSLGNAPDLEIHQQIPTGFRLFFAESEGIITDIQGVDEIAQNPHVVEIELYKQAGDRVLLPPRIFQAHGHMIVQASSLENLDQTVNDLTQKLAIKVKATELRTLTSAMS